MENPSKPPLEEKLYNCPRIVDANIKNETSRVEVRQVECGKNFALFGKKQQEVASPPQVQVVDMSPPPYSDLGKKAKDVFNKGYHFGLVKLDVKTKSNTGVEFTSSGTSNQESGKVAGSLETKYKVKDYGFTFTEKWTTENNLNTEFAVQDQFVPGLKLSTSVNFAPQTGGNYDIKGSNVSAEYKTDRDWGKVETKGSWKPLNKTGTVKAAYVNNQVALNVDSDLTGDGPLVTASAVVGYQGWLAGYLAGYDINNKKLTKSNFALGFSTPDFTIHSNVDWAGDVSPKFGGSIYQAINPKLEYGIMVDWAKSDGNSEEGGDDDGDSATKFAVGAQYQLNTDASVRFKVDNNRHVGLGYQQRLREGVTIWLSALIDGKNLDQGGGHKVGFALELEA